MPYLSSKLFVLRNSSCISIHMFIIVLRKFGLEDTIKLMVESEKLDSNMMAEICSFYMLFKMEIDDIDDDYKITVDVESEVSTSILSKVCNF